MSEILFYCINCDLPPPPIVLPPPGITITVWHPPDLRFAPACGLSWLSRAAWPACHWLGLFGNRDHAILCLRRDTTYVHRTLLIPPFFRFPFMAANDLQCGDIWTGPSERGRGLAVVGVSAAVRHAWRPGRRIWYLTEAANVPSIRLAHHAGFSLVGKGKRTRKLGLRFFGQFV